ncbi:hypothetical protein ACJZ2D_012689 [Fusarium nematophilum]
MGAAAGRATGAHGEWSTGPIICLAREHPACQGAGGKSRRRETLDNYRLGYHDAREIASPAVAAEMPQTNKMRVF